MRTPIDRPVSVAHRAVLVHRGLFFWLNWPGWLSNAVLRPALTVALFGLVARHHLEGVTADVYAFRVAAFGIPTVMIGGITQTFFYEQQAGTLAQALTVDTSRLSLYFARVPLHLPNAFAALTAGLITAALVADGSWAHVRWLPLGVAAVGAMLGAAGLSLFVGSLVLAIRDWIALTGVASGLVLLFSGIVIPRDALPAPLPGLSALVPFAHALGALEAAYQGATWDTVVPLIGKDLLCGAVYACLGYGIFRLIVLRGQQTGSLARL